MFFTEHVTCIVYVWIDAKSRDVPNEASEASKDFYNKTALML